MKKTVKPKRQLKPKSLKESLANAFKIYSRFPKWKKEAFKIDTSNQESAGD